MKDVFRFALRAFALLAGGTIITLAFTSAVLSDTAWVAAVMTIVLILAIAYLAFQEGTLKGRKDKMFEASMLRQEQERGLAPTKEERTRFFIPWKGFVGALIAASPMILISIVILFVDKGAQPMTMILRFVMAIYIGTFNWLDALMPYVYLPLALILPIVMGFGYLYGPRLYEKMLKQIDDSKKKRRRRKKKKKTEPTA